MGRPCSALEVRAMAARAKKWAASLMRVADSQSEHMRRLSKSGHELGPLDRAQRRNLLRSLPVAQVRVLLNKQEDRTGRTANGLANRQLKQRGFFVCALGGLPLFSAKDYQGNLGSNQLLTFSRPVDYEHITEDQVLFAYPRGSESMDTATREAHGIPNIPGILQTELKDARTGSHLGWSFKDAATNGGQELYVVTPAALHFVSEEESLYIPKACWNPCMSCPHKDVCEKKVCFTYDPARLYD